MKGLLLAGGYGKRLRPLTFAVNKHILPLANKPMILYGLQHLLNAGIKDIGVILGPLKDDIVKLLGDGSRYGAQITYIDQPEPIGLAHAVLSSQSFLENDPFILYLGDNLLKQGLKPFMDTLKNNDSDCVIGVTKVQDSSCYGVAVFNEDGQIEGLVEKPKDHLSDWALIGVYVFTKKIFSAIKMIHPSRRGELEITDAIQRLLVDGSKVDVQFIKGWWKDLGRPDDLLETNRLILEEISLSIQGKIEVGVEVIGNVEIGEGTVVHNQARIKGPVVIGKNCNIGPNADIGPYTSIGDDVIFRNGEIENSIIMEKSFIDCGKRIYKSLLGRQVSIIDRKHHLPEEYELILGNRSSVSF